MSVHASSSSVSARRPSNSPAAERRHIRANTAGYRSGHIGPDGLTQNQRDYYAKRQKRLIAEQKAEGGYGGQHGTSAPPDAWSIAARCNEIRREWGFRLPADATPEQERVAREMLLRESKRSGERYKARCQLGRDRGDIKPTLYVPGLERLTKTSKYIGVYRLAARMPVRWRASVYHDGKSKQVGTFPTEEVAARAYDAAARRIKGPGCKLNFPEESIDGQ